MQLNQILSVESLSQQELAKRIGVSFATLNRWLNGHAHPHKKRLEQIECLFREVVMYSSITEKDVASILKEIARSKNRSICKIIFNSESLQDDLILEHTYNSTTIEGTTFTKKETEAVIFDKANIKEKSLLEHIDVVNYSSIFRQILKGDISKKITEQGIKDIHKSMMQGVREDGGLYSQYQRGIRGVDITLTHPKDIPEEMKFLIRRWDLTKKKDLRAIANFHSDFELIHPFGDGNGRVGRLIMAMQCLDQNYAPVIIENSRKAQYYEVLEFSQRKSENPFVQFLAQEMKRTIKIIQKYL
jgi:Fic family protein